MTVTSVRIDGCADQMNKKPDLIILKNTKQLLPKFNQG